MNGVPAILDIMLSGEALELAPILGGGDDEFGPVSKGKNRAREGGRQKGILEGEGHNG